MAMVVSEPTFPGDLYSVNLDTKAEKVLTASNKDLLEQVYIESPEIVPFKAETACRSTAGS